MPYQFQYAQWIHKHLMMEFIAQKYRLPAEAAKARDLRGRFRKMSRVRREVKYVA